MRDNFTELFRTTIKCRIEFKHSPLREMLWELTGSMKTSNASLGADGKCLHVNMIGGNGKWAMIPLEMIREAFTLEDLFWIVANNPTIFKKFCYDSTGGPRSIKMYREDGGGHPIGRIWEDGHEEGESIKILFGIDKGGYCPNPGQSPG